MAMRLVFLLLATAAPAMAQAAAHSGIAGDRTGPEPSDIALAIFAAGAVWFVRRALRARFRNERSADDRDSLPPAA